MEEILLLTVCARRRGGAKGSCVPTVRIRPSELNIPILWSMCQVCILGWEPGLREPTEVVLRMKLSCLRVKDQRWASLTERGRSKAKMAPSPFWNVKAVVDKRERAKPLWVLHSKLSASLGSESVESTKRRQNTREEYYVYRSSIALSPQSL